MILHNGLSHWSNNLPFLRHKEIHANRLAMKCLDFIWLWIVTSNEKLMKTHLSSHRFHAAMGQLPQLRKVLFFYIFLLQVTGIVQKSMFSLRISRILFFELWQQIANMNMTQSLNIFPNRHVHKQLRTAWTRSSSVYTYFWSPLKGHIPHMRRHILWIVVA